MDESNGSIGVDDLRNLVGDLRTMARRLLKLESKANTYTPTALAMTALRRSKLKEQDWNDVRWDNRSHFFGALCLAMRHALIDHARRKGACGRENVLYFSPDEDLFQDLPADAEECPERIILLEEALAKLEAADQRLADVVNQFYFMGFSTAEVARCLEISEKTVDRDLKKARVLLRSIVDELHRNH